ncbi:MAG: hypothetical protein SGPRY_012976, partial [Prymnesium sp.]
RAGEPEHSPEQQAFQLWLFSRCDRLPNDLRVQCVRRTAGFAAALQQGASEAELRELRVETAAALALYKRSTYMPESELSPEEDVEQAARAAQVRGAEGCGGWRLPAAGSSLIAILERS